MQTLKNSNTGTATVPLDSNFCKVPPGHVGLTIGVQGKGAVFGLMWSEDLNKTLRNFDAEAAADPHCKPEELVDAIMQQACRDFEAGDATSLPTEALVWVLLRLRSDPGRDTEAQLRGIVRRDGTAGLCGIVTDPDEGMVAVIVTEVAPEDREKVH